MILYTLGWFVVFCLAIYFTSNLFAVTFRLVRQKFDVTEGVATMLIYVTPTIFLWWVIFTTEPFHVSVMYH